MQAYAIAGAALAGVALLALKASASPDITTVNFAVMRGGMQIGTNSIQVGREGDDISVQTVTHVSVGFGFLTLYRFDQTETEEWAGGRLVAMKSATDDNGTLHRVSATARDGKILVQANKQVQELAPTTVPLNLWNPDLVDQNQVLDPEDGSLEPVKVFDRGEENVTVQGRTRRAHHYQIVTTFPQDVWYGEDRQLVQVELKGSDGSTIRYQLL